MHNVISLSEYRANKACCADNPASLDQVRPLLDSEIMSRDFSDMGDQVFGILKLREIFDRHLHFNEEWKHYLLCLLGDVHAMESRDVRASYRENVTLLKQYILEETNETNKRDMATAFTLLELMRHSQPKQEGLRH